MRALSILALLVGVASCDRDRRERRPIPLDEVATPVERPDAPSGADWCEAHGVQESRCEKCLAQDGSGTAVGTCGGATTCQDGKRAGSGGSASWSPATAVQGLL